MRPINKGYWPINPKTNKKAVFHSEKAQEDTTYRDASPYLSERLGKYCCYCERKISNPTIDHIRPKSRYPELRGDWDNFLLACNSCNSTKKNKDIINLDDYYWPHLDNTACIFEYQEGGIIYVNPSLTDDQKEKAQNTIKLTGLNNLNPDSNRTSRLEERGKVWREAKKYFKNLQNNDTPEMRECIVDLASASGHWSIWMTVFKEDIDMLNRFINAFPGTEFFGIVTRTNNESFQETLQSIDSDIAKNLVNAFSSNSVWMTISRQDDDILKYLLKKLQNQAHNIESANYLDFQAISIEANSQNIPILNHEAEEKETISTLNSEKPKPIPKTDKKQTLYNPSLIELPRDQRAPVIRLKQEDSILDWLEATGRLLARDDRDHDYLLEYHEEISDLMAIVDSTYDDLEDDDIVEDDSEIIED